MTDTQTETTALRTLIVDDEPLAVERVQVICAEIPSVRVHDRGVKKSGIVTFSREDMPPADLASQVKAAGVNVSLSTPDYSRRDFEARGLDGVVRASPHAYNTIEEVDRLLDAVANA